MDYDFLQDYCLAKKGAIEEYKPDWDAILFKVGGKMFALVGNDGLGNPTISLKLDPNYSEELRSHYHPDILPAYHMNKTHWNSLNLTGNVPSNILKQMIDQSYDLVVHGLPLKLKAELF